MEENTRVLVDQVNAILTDPERNFVVGDNPEPRFELYHFSFSICSNKVRAVLAEKNLGYTSHIMNFVEDNYKPPYVRLRLKGGGQLKTRAQSYTGRSSTETEGFDACVVPTMVDHEADSIIVDSKAICLYLGELPSGTDLIPADIREAVLRQVDIVDRTPHVAILYGKHPGEDPRPKDCQKDLVGIHAAKCELLNNILKSVEGDAALEEAYRNKIAKETSAGVFIATPEEMQGVLDETEALVQQLDRDLSEFGGDWICGDRYTMADIFWAISLFRFKWLGLERFWKDEGGVKLEKVNQYVDRALSRDSIRKEVIDFPGCPPSENL